MAKDLGKVLKETKIQSLSLRKPLCVKGDVTIEKVISLMEQQRNGSALIEEHEKPVGIFTEQDLLKRVIEPVLSLKTAVQDVMTPAPKTLKFDDSVADAIKVMREGGYRHIPLVDHHGKIQGILSVRELIRHLAEHFPHEVYNLPPDIHQVQRAPDGA
ncbi:MAG: CBS domain-containing protein [Deltaproteobacteria bacterium]|nr:CBS domain-containing protein [Deltaproteobacteria bacterium]